MFKLWADVYVPKLIYQPKWYSDDKDLSEGDLVYMQKEADNVLGSKWIIGVVDQIILSRDGRVRRVIVRYQNATENQPRLTDRSVRKLVKIFDIEEYVLQDDLTELMRRLDEDKGDVQHGPDVGPQVASSNLNADYFSKIDPNFVSGTWLLPPVPSYHSQQFGEEEGPVQEEVKGHEEALVGDRRQVPAGLQSHNISPESGSHVPNPVPSPAENPNFSAALVQSVMEQNPSPLDNCISIKISEQFDLAIQSNHSSSYIQCEDPFEDHGLLQLLQCTSMNLE